MTANAEKQDLYLNNKISTASFQLEQLKIAQSAMKNILKASFDKEDTEEEK